MREEVRVEIGGIGFLFRYNNSKLKERNKIILENIEDFIGSGRFSNNDFVIDIEVGRLPKYPKKEMLFESSENWRSYSYNRSFIIETFSNKESDITRLCIINRDLDKARVYISPWAEEFANKSKHKRFSEKSWSLGSFMVVLGQLILISILARYQGLLIHSSGIVVNGQGIIFPGISTAGKTTLAKLWQGRDGVTVLSDDRIIVRKRKQGYLLYGTPWPGEARIVSNRAAPLRKIIFLSKAHQNRLSPLVKRDSFHRLLTQCFPAIWDKEGIDFFLKFSAKLVEDIPCFAFDFVSDKSAVEYIENHLSSGLL